jgi:hypothetical protein
LPKNLLLDKMVLSFAYNVGKKCITYKNDHLKKLHPISMAFGCLQFLGLSDGNMKAGRC